MQHFLAGNEMLKTIAQTYPGKAVLCILKSWGREVGAKNTNEKQNQDRKLKLVSEALLRKAYTNIPV